jgi:hypothetical protein
MSGFPRTTYLGGPLAPSGERTILGRARPEGAQPGDPTVEHMPGPDVLPHPYADGSYRLDPNQGDQLEDVYRWVSDSPEAAA